MATYSTDLFDLIKTLTVTEKAYFKKYAYKQNTDAKDNPYLRLFDAIDKQEEYDEEKLVKKFSKEKFAQKFSAAKNYLHQLILDCLANYDAAGISIRHKLRMQIRHIEALIDRGLMEQALKKVEATRKLLHPDNIINQYSWHIELINLQLEILPYKTETFDERMKLQNEKSEIFAVTGNCQEYYNLYLKSLHFLNQTGISRLDRHKRLYEEFTETVAHPLLSDLNLALSFNARLFFCNTWVNYYMGSGDFYKALHYAQLQLDQFNTPMLKTGNVQKYMVSVKGVLLPLIKLEDYHRFDKLVEQTEQWYSSNLSNITPESVNVVMDAIYGAPFDAFYYQKSYRKAISLIPKMREYLANAFAQRNKGNNLQYRLNIAALYFYEGDLNNALTELELLLDDKDFDTLPVIHGSARILHLLIHFELKNDLLLESLGRATYRFLFQTEASNNVESLIIRFMRNSAQFADKKELKAGLTKLRQKLEMYAEDEFEQDSFYRIHYLEWVNSKLEGTTVIDWAEKHSSLVKELKG
ncbi:MAG: hypothetical protein IPM47_12080 [Sphingobacteriales bacterium]|nr:MAG: hypothetical protein IPM47_12080 [Sphingobacteriales bacterium]